MYATVCWYLLAIHIEITYKKHRQNTQYNRYVLAEMSTTTNSMLALGTCTDMSTNRCYAAAWSVRSGTVKIFQGIAATARRLANILRVPLSSIDTSPIRHWIAGGSVVPAIPITIPWHGTVSSVTKSATWPPSTRVNMRQQQQRLVELVELSSWS